MSIVRLRTDASVGDIYELTTPRLRAHIAARGGCVLSLWAADRKGDFADVMLGYGDLADYVENPVYFAALIGRYGNRIARGELPLDGRIYHLPINNGPNSLHGGPHGFHAVMWTMKEARGGEEPALVLAYESADGEAGYPGNLSVEVTYTLTREPALRIEYAARPDRRTVVNLTHHAYFNLGSAQTIDDHVLRLAASRFLPVDDHLIPTGELRAVKGTPFDFQSPTAVGARVAASDEQLERGDGYDHCFAIDGWDGSLRTIGDLSDPPSGRCMIVRTTEPGVQLYSGNYLAGVRGRNGAYVKRAGLCLETQHFPDSPHHPEFPATELGPGDRYRSMTEYAFVTGDRNPSSGAMSEGALEPAAGP